MKRIKNADIKIKLSDFKGITPNFRIRFYTTNSTFYVEKTTVDLVWDEVDEDIEYIKLNWTELDTIGRGVMNYILFTYVSDSDFDDGVFDNSYQRTTDYFIDSSVIIDDEQPSQSLSQMIADEIARSTQKDEEHDEAIANLQDEIDNIDVDLSDYYTKDEIDDMELVTSSALNDLNDRINEIDLTGYATETWVSTNYYNKTYIDTTIGNIETLLSQI